MHHIIVRLVHRGRYHGCNIAMLVGVAAVLTSCSPRMKKERDEGRKPLAGFEADGQYTSAPSSNPAVASTTAVSGESVPMRGEAAYNKYCISCHGALGDGKGPAALNPRLRPRDFTSSNWQRGATDEHIRLVIRDGGQAQGMSSYMPPWSPLLDDKTITALVAKVRSFVPATERQSPVVVVRGEHRTGLPSRSRAAYDFYCSSCHGPTGQGDGYAASKLNERPRDFSDQQWQDSVSDAHIQAVIREGGVAHALSSDMPAWGNLFTPSELKALTDFIRDFTVSRMPSS